MPGIREYDETTALTGEEAIPLDQSGVTKFSTPEQIAALATKITVGLPNAEDTADLSKPISTAQAGVNTVQLAVNAGVAQELSDLRTGVEIGEIVDITGAIDVHIPLDENSSNAVDTIASLTMTEEGGTPIAGAAGKVGTSRLFVTADESRLVSGADPSAFRHANGSFGFSVWLKPNSVLATSSILSKSDGVSTGEYILYFTATTVVLTSTRSTGTGTTTLTRSSTLPIGVWSCVQCWYDGTTLNMMVDGGVVISTPASFGIYDTANQFYLGFGKLTSAAGTRNYFDGTIDEFIFWKGDKAVSELRAIYDANSLGTPYPYAGVIVPSIVSGLAGKWDGGPATRSRPDSTNFSRTLTPISAPSANSVGWGYDGTDDYHERTDAGIDVAQACSIVATFNPDSISGPVGVLGKGNSSGNQLSLGINSSGKAIVHFLSGASDETLVSTGADLVAGKSNAVLITNSGTNISLETYPQVTANTVVDAVDSVVKPFRIGYGKVSSTASENFFAGEIRDVCYYDRVISTEEFRRLVDAKLAVQAWGDSLTTPSGGDTWVAQLQVLRNNFAVGGNGYSGEGTPEIRAHYDTANRDRDQIHIFWGGNNSASRGVALETADTAAMVAGLRTDRFLVLGLPNRTPYTETDGVIAVAAANFDPLNAAYSTIYGGRFLDLQDLFINTAISADVDDTADKARGIVQRSFKDVGGTGTHFDGLAGAFIADQIDQKLTALGWGV